jgi:hypothetical protein
MQITERKLDVWMSHSVFNSFFFLVCEAIGTAATPGLIVPASGYGEGDCGEADGM